MSRQRRRTHRFKLRSLYVWHRYMGISAALIVLVVAFTGILLNHTEDFQFDSQYVKSEWILDWYGIRPPDELLSYPAGNRFVTLMGDHLYLNRREIPGEFHDLVGAVSLHDMFIVAVSDSILLLTERGEIIEQLRSNDGVPAGLTRIGLDTAGRLVTEGSHDTYQPDSDFLKWQRWDHQTGSINWTTPGRLPENLKSALQQHYMGEVLPTERVLLDLHSGRILGRLGPWLFDIAALFLILLSLSGTWIWIKRRR